MGTRCCSEPFAGPLRIFFPILLLQLVLGRSWAWGMVSLSPKITLHPSRLRASYLDGLSTPSPEEEEAPQLPNTRAEPEGPKWATPTGGIPTGRGPQASYLQNMNAGISDGEEEEDDPEDEEEYASSARVEERPASWSPEYLSDFLSGDDPRTDVRNLLTQRSLQSFMRLLEECRDPHSAKWIQEDFLRTGNLLDYHGTGAAFIEAFGGSWEASLLGMSQQPKTRIIISAKRRGRGHGGWSKNNPYLKERWVEYPVDIHPASLCDRVLTVREQLAGEWEDDLEVLLTANDAILDSYFGRVRALRDAEAGSHGEAVAGGGGPAFERTAVNLINDQSRLGANSPFRRANFDLLYTLCTQAAIHRLLRAYISQGKEHEVGFLYLKRFYTDRAVEFFDGYLSFGRADEFVDELLQSSPSLLMVESGGRAGLVDPIGTAEDIIRMRSVVATEWKEIMRQVPDAHIVVKQSILSEQARASKPSIGGTDTAAFQ